MWLGHIVVEGLVCRARFLLPKGQILVHSLTLNKIFGFVDLLDGTLVRNTVLVLRMVWDFNVLLDSYIPGEC